MFIKLNLDEIEGFDWDEANIKKNELKHQVLYKECEEIFSDKPLYIRDEKHSKNEIRLYAFGETNKKRVLTITFTMRNNKIRVISARDQDKKEKFFYSKNIINYQK